MFPKWAQTPFKPIIFPNLNSLQKSSSCPNFLWTILILSLLGDLTELSLRAMTGHSQGHEKTEWGMILPKKGEQDSVNWRRQQQRQAQQFSCRRAFCLRGHGAPVHAGQQGHCPYVHASPHWSFPFPGSMSRRPWRGRFPKEEKPRGEWKTRGGLGNRDAVVMIREWESKAWHQEKPRFTNYHLLGCFHFFFSF